MAWPVKLTRYCRPKELTAIEEAAVKPSYFFFLGAMTIVN